MKNEMGNSGKNSAGKINSPYNWANGLTGGSLSVFNDAVQHFVGARAAEASASIAYYAIFSLFPLLIILVVVGSFVLESEDVERWVLDFEAEVIPVSHQLIEENIQRIFELRGTVGFVALVGLSWSATSVLAVLVRNINCAWTEAEPRNFLESRLMALGIVGGLVVLLFLSSVLTTVLGTLARFSVPDNLIERSTTADRISRASGFLLLGAKREGQVVGGLLGSVGGNPGVGNRHERFYLVPQQRDRAI
jgi:membrane protein